MKVIRWIMMTRAGGFIMSAAGASIGRKFNFRKARRSTNVPSAESILKLKTFGWRGRKGRSSPHYYERFCCNRGFGSQNPLRYSFFAPRSCKGRSTSQARWRRTWTRLDRRPGRRARRSVGQHTAGDWRPSFWRLSPSEEQRDRHRRRRRSLSLTAPRACLAWRLRDFATNRHE